MRTEDQDEEAQLDTAAARESVSIEEERVAQWLGVRAVLTDT